MHTFQVTIPALDLVNTSIAAHSRKKAALKALTIEASAGTIDPDTSLEVIVLSESGKKSVFDVVPLLTLSFRCRKVG